MADIGTLLGALLKKGAEAANIGTFLNTESVSKSTRDLNKSLEGFSDALKTQNERLQRANVSLLHLDEQIVRLCSDLQRWVQECGCSGGEGTNVNFNFALNVDVPINFSSGSSVVAGGLSQPGESRGSDVRVEVHNYGPQSRAGGRASGGRDIHQIVGEVVAKDVRRGGPASNAIKRAFGVTRQPIQR